MPKCKLCKKKFEAFNSTQPFCSPDHAYAWLNTEEGKAKTQKVREKAAKKKIAAQKKKDRETKERLKSRGEWIAHLQKEFNRFIRLRDHYQPCISCGRHDSQIQEQGRGGKWDAGHYRSVGSTPELRFTEDNVHKQCKKCNNFQSGNHVEYRKYLIERIGIERVLVVEGPTKPLKLSIPEIRELIKHYRQKANELQKQIEEAV